MPYHFEFDVENKILLILPEGEIGEQDVATFNDEIRKHVRDLNPSGAIIDCSAVTAFQSFRRRVAQSSNAARSISCGDSPLHCGPNRLPIWNVANVSAGGKLGRVKCSRSCAPWKKRSPASGFRIRGSLACLDWFS